MLTRSQLEAAETTELEKLADRVKAELERRREQKEMEKASREVLESHDTPQGTYQWEMVRCGHPEQCQSGEKHGPYLYRYLYKDGRRTSQYIRLKDAERIGFSRPVTSLVEVFGQLLYTGLLGNLPSSCHSTGDA